VQALTLGLLLLFVFVGIPVAAALGLLGISLDAIYMDSRLVRGLGEFVWERGKDPLLVAIPMFVLLGEIILRAGIARRMYDALAMWMSWLPGGLMHANIGTCTIFAATSGSSVATAATVGTVAYPQIAIRGYHEGLFLGTIAAGGTLGILIPPSINLILYGMITNTSVPELYLAGLIPGVVLSLLFLATIVAVCVARPGHGGERIVAAWGERIRALPYLIPPLILFLLVVGSIYAGLATPTESASIGVVAALIMAWTRGALTRQVLRDSVEGTIRTTAMIFLIVTAAMFLNFVLGFLGVTQALTGLLQRYELSPLATMGLFVVFYIILGMFMETLSMMLTTVPLVYPVVAYLGFDGVWFGILITLLIELALITPPIGLNLFVVQGIRARGGPFRDVSRGALPFAGTILVMIGLLIAFPGIALWLPGLIY
jgi:C4-dicarboxylate transporter DctM subunit